VIGLGAASASAVPLMLPQRVGRGPS
jgi:hypothetical protein